MISQRYFKGTFLSLPPEYDLFIEGGKLALTFKRTHQTL